MIRFVVTPLFFLRACFAISVVANATMSTAQLEERIAGAQSNDSPPDIAAADHDASSTRDMDQAKIRRILELSTKVMPLLDNGDISGAMRAQKEIVSLLQNTSSKNKPWQTQRDIAFLAEIHRVSQLTPEKRKTYLVGRKQVAGAAQKLAVADYDAAEKLLAEALDNYKRSIGENSFAAAGTLDAIGSVFTLMDEPAKAIEHFSRALTIRKSILGPRHVTFFRELAYIGGAHVVAKEFKKAETNFRDALLLYRSFHGASGASDIDYAVLLGNLSYVLAEQDRLLEAEAVCLQAISITEELQKHDSEEMFTLQYVLGIVAIGFEEYERAEYYLRRALILRDKWLPSNTSLHAQVLDRYAVVLHKLSRSDEAADTEKKAATIRAEARMPPIGPGRE